MRVLVPVLALSLLAGCAGDPDDIRNRPSGRIPVRSSRRKSALPGWRRRRASGPRFRETAAPEAVMFVPQRVKARDWLKSQKDPAEAVKWQPHSVYVSCDGNAGVTTGAWQKGPANGFFTTVWLRDPRSGKINWILDHGDELGSAREAPEFIASKQAVSRFAPRRADRGGRRGRGHGCRPVARPDAQLDIDRSRRQVAPRNDPPVDGKAMATVIDDRVAAPKQP